MWHVALQIRRERWYRLRSDDEERKRGSEKSQKINLRTHRWWIEFMMRTYQWYDQAKVLFLRGVSCCQRIELNLIIRVINILIFPNLRETRTCMGRTVVITTNSSTIFCEHNNTDVLMWKRCFRIHENVEHTLMILNRMVMSLRRITEEIHLFRKWNQRKRNTISKS